MTLAIHPRRREADIRPADYAIAILRDTKPSDDQIREIVQQTICKYPLRPDTLALIVDAIALKAGEMADAGWHAMEDVAVALEEASGCLLKVKDPSYERSQDEEYELQKSMREFMFEGYR